MIEPKSIIDRGNRLASALKLWWPLWLASEVADGDYDHLPSDHNQQVAFTPALREIVGQINMVLGNVQLFKRYTGLSEWKATQWRKILRADALAAGKPDPYPCRGRSRISAAVMLENQRQANHMIAVVDIWTVSDWPSALRWWQAQHRLKLNAPKGIGAEVHDIAKTAWLLRSDAHNLHIIQWRSHWARVDADTDLLAWCVDRAARIDPCEGMVESLVDQTSRPGWQSLATARQLLEGWRCIEYVPQLRHRYCDEAKAAILRLARQAKVDAS